EEACRLYLEAIRCHQGDDGLPLRAIEQLANLEARRGEANGDESLLRSALRRLQALMDLLGEDTEIQGQQDGIGRPAEWFALMGSTHAMLAGLRAKEMVSRKRSTSAQLEAVQEALDCGIQAYGRAGADQGHQIHRLTLQAVRHLPSKGEAGVLRGAITLEDDMRAAFERQPSFWEGIRAADALLARKLLDGSLAEPGAKGQEAGDAVIGAYQNVFLTCPASPLKRESALDHLDLLASILSAKGLARGSAGAACNRAAKQLARMRQELRAEGKDPLNAAAAAPADEDDGLMVLG
ncbi:MAG: hypothetical protein VKM17_05440, partial [Cyanobacteriota bacterium]|nr:hypothetical protein [Cyanobacteriota bacterium]